MRYLGTNSGKLRRTAYTDLNGRHKERLEGGTWLCLLNALCHHANSNDRQTYAGIKLLATEAGCNLDAVYQWLDIFAALGWITERAPRRSDNSHKKARCFEITLPDLMPLNLWQEQEVVKEAEWVLKEAERKRLRKVPKEVPKEVPLKVPPDNDESVMPEGSAGNGLPEYKQEHKPPRSKNLRLVKSLKNGEEYSLVEQVINRYAELTMNKTVNAIANKDAFRSAVIRNASGKTKTPKGETYKDCAQRLLDIGKTVEDIARYLADGCIGGQNMIHWDNREGFEQTDTA